MEIEISEEIIEFDEELYQKNIEENEFAELEECDGIGDESNAIN